MTGSPNPGKPSRLRAGLLNTVLLLGSLGMAVLLAEAAVRLVAPQQLIMLRPDLWQPADTVGWLRRPNVDASVNTGQGAVRLIADQDGFRVGPLGRTDGLPVLFLGDSFIEALQVDYENSVTGLVEDGLEAAGGTSVAVRNAGIGGWSPSQYFLRARTLLPREDYRLVITAIFVGNDAQPVRHDYFPPRENTERHRFRIPDELTTSEFVDAALRPLNDVLEERSHLYVMMRNRLETVRMKTGLSPMYFPREFLRSEATAERWAVTGDICRDISELAAQYGARALFVLIPTNFQTNPATFEQYTSGFGIDPASVDLEQPTRRLLEELTTRNLDVVDALPLFRERHRAGQTLYGDVDPHLSVDGHRALADLIVPAAAGLLFRESEDRP